MSLVSNAWLSIWWKGFLTLCLSVLAGHAYAEKAKITVLNLEQIKWSDPDRNSPADRLVASVRPKLTFEYVTFSASKRCQIFQ